MRALALLTLYVAFAAGAACGGSGSHHRKGHDAGSPADAAADAETDAGHDGGRTLSPEQALEDYQSGSRLHARVLASAEGPVEWLGWHDAMRDEDCTFVTTTDGKLRCLPWGGTPARPVFSDAKCSAPASVRPKSLDCTPPAPKYAMEVEVVDCTSRHTLRPLGKVSSTAKMVFTKVGDACTGRMLANEQLFALGAPLAPTLFVSAKQAVQNQGERLGALVQTGDDGSIQRIGWYDTQLKAACELGIMSSDGSTRCVPSNYVFDSNSWFSDVMCKTRVAIGFATECANGTPVIRRFQDVGCASRTSAFTLGDELMEDTVFAGPDNCRPAIETLPTESGAHFYGLGKELTSASLAALKAAPLGKARLQATYEQSAGGKRRVVRGHFYDLTLKAACTFARASDGTQRCVPASLYDNEAYSDKACKNPIAGASAQATCKPPATYVTIKEGSPLNCNGSTRVYRGGTAIATAPSVVYFKLSDGSCSAGGTSATSFIRVGSEIAAQSMVEATPKTE